MLTSGYKHKTTMIKILIIFVFVGDYNKNRTKVISFPLDLVTNKMTNENVFCHSGLADFVISQTTKAHSKGRNNKIYSLNNIQNVLDYFPNGQL